MVLTCFYIYDGANPQSFSLELCSQTGKSLLGLVGCFKPSSDLTPYLDADVFSLFHSSTVWNDMDRFFMIICFLLFFARCSCDMFGAQVSCPCVFDIKHFVRKAWIQLGPSFFQQRHNFCSFSSVQTIKTFALALYKLQTFSETLKQMN